ncbi:hypothetical protein EXIGLDRAFT_841534 [Exidia glandulosa HHB12029]|uniref:Uncharacterized protein n=1 Tax=Exidia glandulosa HHB12029 TaxID=1314781 RepID=A0A165DUV1_EXIGL|nr:hypothetical protein EXIGLDRAFT_841534 [Exidia glandulosa HHB12029]
MPPRGRFKASLRKGGTVARVGLNLLHSAADAIPQPAGPVVKAVTGGLRGLASRSDAYKENKAAAARVQHDGERVAQLLLKCLNHPDTTPDLIQRVHGHSEELDKLANELPDLAHTKRTQRFLHAEKHKAAISEVSERIQSLHVAVLDDIVLHRGESVMRPMEVADPPAGPDSKKTVNALAVPSKLRNYHLLIVSSVLFRF